MDSADIFMQFISAINNHDVQSLTALMTTDHVFRGLSGESGAQRNFHGGRMAQLLRNVSGLLDSHRLRDGGRWRGVSGGGGGRDYRQRVMADARGLEGSDS